MNEKQIKVNAAQPTVVTLWGKMNYGYKKA